jgi:hypothetical protein
MNYELLKYPPRSDTSFKNRSTTSSLRIFRLRLEGKMSGFSVNAEYSPSRSFEEVPTDPLVLAMSLIGNGQRVEISNSSSRSRQVLFPFSFSFLECQRP